MTVHPLIRRIVPDLGEALRASLDLMDRAERIRLAAAALNRAADEIDRSHYIPGTAVPTAAFDAVRNAANDALAMVDADDFIAANGEVLGG